MLAALAGGELKAAFHQLSMMASTSTTRKNRTDYEKSCAIIHNLYHDDRISKARAKEYLKQCALPLDATSLLRGLKVYHENHVRQGFGKDGSHFAFNDEKSNRHNFLDATKYRGLSYLGTTFNLSRDELGTPIHNIALVLSSKCEVQGKACLHQIIDDLDAKGRQKVTRALKRIQCSESKGNSECRRLIQQSLDGAGNDKQRRQIVQAVFELLALHRRSQNHEPVWAFDWNELEAVLTRLRPPQKLTELSPESWIESVGGYAAPGDWIALVKYPANRPRRLIRPTQLDAGCHPYHFPSPAKESTSGHPVWLGFPCRADHSHLIKEFIHESVTFSSAEIVAVKQVSRATPSSKGTCGHWRGNHWQVLSRELTSVGKWMPDIAKMG